MSVGADQVEGFIREQPGAVATTYAAVRAALAQQVLPQRRDLALVGSGSSFNALSACAPMIGAAAGAAVHVRGPTAFMAELAAGRLRPTLVIALSQSGSSVTTIEAARMAHARGVAALRITAQAESPFAQLAPDPIIMPIGPEPIGPKTKGYTASLAALAAAADWMAGREGVAPEVDMRILDTGRVAAQALAGAARDVDFVLVVGQGPHLGTALEASLKIAEMSGIPAAGVETEEALHGRLHGLTPRSLAIFVAGCVREQASVDQAARVMRDLGVMARIVGPAPDRDVFGLQASAGSGEMDTGSPTRTWSTETTKARAPELGPVDAIIPFQWLAWSLARNRGLEPAAMRYPGLSQRLAIKTGSAA
jgi:fructoselysine-6-P-deglycase FrlB-like protein